VLKAAVTGSSSPSVTLFYELEASSRADVGPDGDRQILIPPGDREPRGHSHFFKNSFSMRNSRASFELTQPFSFADVQRRLVAGVLAPVRGDPIPQGAFPDAEFTSNRGDRAQSLDYQPHRFFPKLRGETRLRA